MNTLYEAQKGVYWPNVIRTILILSGYGNTLITDKTKTFGCTRKFIAMVKQYHDGIQARVQANEETPEPFPVTNCVKQGCVLAPSLFSLIFSAMLPDAFRDSDIGIGIIYRTDGKLFNIRRLQAITKTTTNIIRNFLFADNFALNAGSEADMQLKRRQVL